MGALGLEMGSSSDDEGEPEDHGGHRIVGDVRERCGEGRSRRSASRFHVQGSNSKQLRCARLQDVPEN